MPAATKATVAKAMTTPATKSSASLTQQPRECPRVIRPGHPGSKLEATQALADEDQVHQAVQHEEHRTCQSHGHSSPLSSPVCRSQSTPAIRA